MNKRHCRAEGPGVIAEAQKKAEVQPPKEKTQRELWDIATPEHREVVLGLLSIGERFELGEKIFEVKGFRGNNIVKAILLEQIEHNCQRIARVYVAGNTLT